MRVLVVGGTIFVGRAVVEELLSRGREVTLLHRGRHPNPFGGDVEELLGDRRNHAALKELLGGRVFDACVDTCGYRPEDVDGLLGALEGVTRRYLFCSTCSVYDYERLSTMPLTEDAPLVEEPPKSDSPDALYGYNKVRCEIEALGRGGFVTTVLRPSYILGPHEPYYREHYFFERAEAGRPLPLPGGGYNAFCFGDVRDLARVFVEAVESERTFGRAYHISGQAVTLRHLTLEALRVAGAGNAEELVRPYQTGRLLELLRRDWGAAGRPPVFPFAWDHSLLLDQSALERDLDWRTAYSLSQTLRDTYDWWVGAGRPLADADWRLDELLLAES